MELLLELKNNRKDYHPDVKEFAKKQINGRFIINCCKKYIVHYKSSRQGKQF